MPPTSGLDCEIGHDLGSAPREVVGRAQEYQLSTLGSGGRPARKSIVRGLDGPPCVVRISGASGGNHRTVPRAQAFVLTATEGVAPLAADVVPKPPQVRRARRNFRTNRAR